MSKLELTAEARDCLRRRSHLKRRIRDLRRKFYQTKQTGTPEEQEAAYMAWKAMRDELKETPCYKDFLAPSQKEELESKPKQRERN